MIKSKNNFKGMLRRKYPNVKSYPIYGLPIYILDRKLSEEDNWNYNVSELPNGKFAAFIGVTVQEATDLLSKMRDEGVPKNSHTHTNPTAPTTFSCFEAWLDRNDYKYINRTFCGNMTPAECFHSESIEGCIDIHHKGTWYMYELPGALDDGIRFSRAPHVTMDYGARGKVIIVLVKASSSRYKSKKQRFIEKFDLMQPIYEKLIAACAIASTTEGSDWSEALLLCNQYMHIQFETDSGSVDVEKLKEAYTNGTLNLFTRDVENLCIEDSETF